MLSERPRRLRRTAALRALVRETRLSADDLILPLFVVPGSGERKEITSMPGVHHISVDRVVEEARGAFDLGVRAVILFGLPSRKDAKGTQSRQSDAPVQRAIRELRQQLPELVVITDVCMCEYTE